jgi:ATP10 protein
MKLDPSTRWIRPLRVALLLLCLALPLAAETIPSTEGENLLGQKVQIANSLKGRIGVLLLGFSKPSGNNVGLWQKRLAEDYASDANVLIYQIPLLESVPGFVRGIIISGMRKDVPKSQQANFVVVVHDEDQWKKVSGYQKSDDCFIMVVDKAGEIRWRGAGDPKLTNYATLHQQIQTLLGR